MSAYSPAPPVRRVCAHCNHAHNCTTVRKEQSSGFGCGWCHERHRTLDDVKTCRFDHRVRTAAEMKALGRDLLELHRDLP